MREADNLEMMGRRAGKVLGQRNYLELLKTKAINDELMARTALALTPQPAIELLNLKLNRALKAQRYAEDLLRCTNAALDNIIYRMRQLERMEPIIPVNRLNLYAQKQ